MATAPTPPVEDSKVTLVKQVVLYADKSETSVYPFERMGNMGSTEMVSAEEAARLSAMRAGYDPDTLVLNPATFTPFNRGALYVLTGIGSEANGTLWADFGDGSPREPGVITSPGVIEFTWYHVYQTDGTFTVRIYPERGAAIALAPRAIVNLAPEILGMAPSGFVAGNPAITDAEINFTVVENLTPETYYTVDGIRSEVYFAGSSVVFAVGGDFTAGKIDNINPSLLPAAPTQRTVQIRAHNRNLSSTPKNFFLNAYIP